MTQFIQYLYEYENGQRVRNLGFMKVDKQMDKTVIQIYAKQLDEVTGIQFQKDNGGRYLATWEEEEEAATEQTPLAQKPSEWGMPVQQQPEQESSVPEQESSAPEQVSETVQQVQNVLPSEERLQEEMSQEEMPQEEAEEVSTYIPPSSRRYEKIQRQDLSRLPRREWRLANNSFLLHGFYNYHHLLYIEDGQEIWIGVPGIYHEKERTAATAFGFPEFRRLTDMELELSEEEKNTYEDFGYWCRQVKG